MAAGQVGRASAQSPEDVVYIRYVVNADYTSNIPYEALSQSQGVLTKDVRVNKDDTLSSIVSKNYGIGNSNAPVAYKAFESFIATTNKIDDPNLSFADASQILNDISHVLVQNEKARTATVIKHLRRHL